MNFLEFLKIKNIKKLDILAEDLVLNDNILFFNNLTLFQVLAIYIPQANESIIILHLVRIV